jgi:hypothetical protein
MSSHKQHKQPRAPRKGFTEPIPTHGRETRLMPAWMRLALRYPGGFRIVAIDPSIVIDDAGQNQQFGPDGSAVRAVIEACWALTDRTIDPLLMTKWSPPDPTILTEVMDIADAVGLREATEDAAWRAKQGVLTSAFRSAFPRRQDIPPEVAASLQEHSDSFEEMVEIIDTILPGVATIAAPPIEYIAIAFVLHDHISTDQFAALALPCTEVLKTSTAASDERVEQLQALMKIMDPDDS